MTTTEPAPTGQITRIPPDQLEPGRNDRRTFDQAELEDLASSLRAVGQLAPIVVRPNPSHRPDPEFPIGAPFEIIAGERRWRASMIAQLDTVDCVIRDGLTDEEVALAMLAENTGRVDLNPIEEAEAYKKSMELGIHKRTIAEHAGVRVSHIEGRLQLLTLCPQARHLTETGQISAAWASLLVGLDSNRQIIAMRHWSTSELTYVEAQLFCEKLLQDQNQDGLLDLDDFLAVEEFAEQAKSENNHLHPLQFAKLADQVLVAYLSECPDDALPPKVQAQLGRLRAAIDYRLKR
jgi:ParB family chromosome partitioning protein